MSPENAMQDRYDAYNDALSKAESEIDRLNVRGELFCSALVEARDILRTVALQRSRLGPIATAALQMGHKISLILELKEEREG